VNKGNGHTYEIFTKYCKYLLGNTAAIIWFTKWQLISDYISVGSSFDVSLTVKLRILLTKSGLLDLSLQNSRQAGRRRRTIQP
jgi:hypothetical protein